MDKFVPTPTCSNAPWEICSITRRDSLPSTVQFISRFPNTTVLWRSPSVILALGSPQNICLAFSTDFTVPNHRADLMAHRSEEHTSELQSPCNLVCSLLLQKK